jgi:urocanate hydratase
MSDRDSLEMECDLASMENIDQALKVAKEALRQAPSYDKALWGEAVKLLQEKLKEKARSL